MENSEFVWLNDELVLRGQARVSVEDRGFLYGDGFFETLRAEAGRPYFLREHLDRLRASAHAFRLPFPADIPWEDRLGRLLAANGLGQGTAAVKILLSRGAAPGLGLPSGGKPTLIIWARPYKPPSPAEYTAGWPVVTFPERRTTFVGRHKSLNYLFYLAARQYALDRGAREAIILEADSLVSEGAATSLVYMRAGRYCTPEAPSALSGVTIQVLARGLARRGLTLEPVPTPLTQIQEAEAIWLANSLMGLMPISSWDGHPVPLAPQASQYLQECLASEALL